jgi:thioredoxin-dependent peroxiredoxin
MAKKKNKKSAKKSKAVKAKKRPAPKKKKAAPKKAKKKTAAKKAAKKKAAPRRPVAKKKTTKKTAPKKAVKKAVKKSAPRKSAPKKSGPKKPVGKKAAAPVTKKPVSKPVEKVKEKKVEATPVVQQEASHSEHRESFIPHATHLRAGDPAPDFRGVDQHGNMVSLDDFNDKTLVLYFYPKDDTEGCTAESCSLRDEFEHLRNEGRAVVGVSADDVVSHKHFADKYQLPFPLIADTDKDIIKAYDVWGKKRLFDHIYDGIVRTTFIIKDKTIQRVITSVDTKNHGKQVMEA